MARQGRLAGVVGTLLLVGVGSADAGKVVVRGALAPTGADADASGESRLEIRDRTSGLRGRLEVRVRGLDGVTRYDVTVDGVRIGTLGTKSGGNGKARFDTRPRGSRQLLGVDPRGRELAVVGTAGVVLSADVSAGSIDPGDVRCCLPDDSGTECEDRTAEVCAAQGGVDMGPGSCLPNPCADGPPGPDDDIRCCLPDDSGTECEDRTPAECAAQGGINIGAGVCTPGACLPDPGVPGGNGTVRVRCERRSNRSKVSVDGNNLPAGTYTARIASGGNSASAGPQASVGDEVEFDFDSDGGDIAEGATAIAPDFLVGTPPTVTGAILGSGGTVVVEATVACEVR